MEGLISVLELIFNQAGTAVIGWLFAFAALAGAGWFVRSILSWVLEERARRDREIAEAVREMAKELREHTQVISFQVRVLERVLEKL